MEPETQPFVPVPVLAVIFAYQLFLSFGLPAAPNQGK